MNNVFKVGLLELSLAFVFFGFFGFLFGSLSESEKIDMSYETRISHYEIENYNLKNELKRIKEDVAHLEETIGIYGVLVDYYSENQKNYTTIYLYIK